MMPFDASSGPADILLSGTVIAFDGNPIALHLPMAPVKEEKPRSTLIFRFETDKSAEGLRTSAKAVDDRTFEITLTNFDNPLGSGTSKPLHVGEFDGRPMFLQYRVYDLAGGDKTLHFTLYVERRGEHVKG